VRAPCGSGLGARFLTSCGAEIDGDVFAIDTPERRES
jgi:hypothetical protein